jgi:hypothetical protein
MQYAAHLPNTRSLAVPMVSLVIGAAGAVGIYAALDETDVTIEPTRVVVQEPNNGAGAKHESATASAIGGPVQSSSAVKDEASIAAAVGGRANPEASFPGKDEATTAAALGGPRQRFAPEGPGKDESATAAAIGGPH